MTEAEENYILAHSSSEPETLHDLYRNTYIKRLYPHMCCEPLQGRLLVMLTQMIAPKRILELGTFSGYSTLCFAEGMPDGSELHTVEIDDEAEAELLATFGSSPRAASIHLHIGDAMQLIPAISDQPWDLVYIDANKRTYLDYYNLVKPLVREGGYIFADNTLWADYVLDSSRKDAQTEGIRRFNDAVAGDDTVEKVILPIYDGITLIRKK